MSARAFSREWALTISDALAAAGISHEIIVVVSDKWAVRERYAVNVTPVLSYSAYNISALQRLADSFGCGIGFVDRSFTFTEPAS